MKKMHKTPVEKPRKPAAAGTMKGNLETIH